MTTVGDASRGWSSRLQKAWLSRGPLAVGLLPIAAIFGMLSTARATLFSIGWLHVHRLAVPVVVVGNLVAGGAGKTPTVIAIVRTLRERGFSPGIISRGYGRDAASLVDVQPDTLASRCGDEPLLLRLRTGVPVMVGRDRVAAGMALQRAHPSVNVIVSDDGLQHWRLARQAQVLVFDERGAGNGWLLPAGPLREHMPRTVPPRTLVLYNADAASTPLPGHLARRSLGGLIDLRAWWAGQRAEQMALDSLKGRPIVAAAGLARPQRFFDMLRANGLTINALGLPDHYDFSSLPWPASAQDVVVTEKDAVKLQPDRMGSTRVWVAALDFDIGSALADALVALLPRAPVQPVHPPESTHGSPTA